MRPTPKAGAAGPLGPWFASGDRRRVPLQPGRANDVDGCVHPRATAVSVQLEDRRLGHRLTGLGWLDGDEERHLEPLPVAVDVVETPVAQPSELALDVEQAV